MRSELLVFMAASIIAVSAVGCGMMRGLGQDVEGGGRSIQRVVNHND